MSAAIVRMLRAAGDPERRLKAVSTLVEWGNLEGVSWLIRAAVEDDDARVRAAAHEALHEIIGAETQAALRAYQADPDEDAWLQPYEEDQDAEAEDDQQAAGLIAVLRHEGDVKLRLKAISALSGNSDLHVIAALAETVLWTDDETLRQAARQAMDQRFGDGAEEIIQSYRVEQDDEAWLDEAEEEAPQKPSAWRAPEVGQPVTREEGFPGVLAVVMGVGVVMMVIVLVLILT